MKIHNSSVNIVYIFITTLFSFVLYKFLYQDYSSHLPFSDEAHSYFHPAIRYFKDGVYNLLDPDFLNKSFGHPPIFHIVLNLGSQIFDKNPLGIRAYMITINLLGIFSISSLLYKTTKEKLTLLIFPLALLTHNIVYTHLNLLLPEIFSSIFAFLTIYTYSKENRRGLYLSCILFLFTREYSVIFAPVLLFTFTYQKLILKRETVFKLYDIIFCSLILSSWFLVHKVHTSYFISVFASGGQNFKVEWTYWINTNLELFTDIFFMTGWIYFLIVGIWGAFSKKNIFIFMSVLTTLGFITGLSFYFFSLHRYQTIALMSCISAFIMYISLIKHKKAKYTHISIAVVIILFNVFISNKSLLTTHSLSQDRVNQYYNTVNKHILDKVSSPVFVDIRIKKMCLMLVHFKKNEFNCNLLLDYPMWNADLPPKSADSDTFIFTFDNNNREYALQELRKMFPWYVDYKIHYEFSSPNIYGFILKK